jgi:hypothetical protein
MSILNLSTRLGRWAGATALVMAMLGGCGGGGSSGPVAPPNAAPAASVLLAGVVDAGGADGADVTASAGSELVLNATGSSDADGDVLTFKWTIVSKPPTSALTLASDSAMVQTVRPDVGGMYVIKVRVTDTKGAFNEKQAKVMIRDNVAPVTNILVTATYLAQTTTKPTQFLNVGSSIVLDASGSTDADGDVVTTTWTLTDKPAASAAALSTDGRTSHFTTDVAGVYKIRARGTDPKGAYSETIYTFDANNRAPQTVVINTVSAAAGESGAATVSAATGYMVALNGAGSSDPDGGALTYAWSVTSKPATSAALLTSATGPASQITPDVLGTYVVKMTVTDVAGAASTYVTTIAVTNRRPLATISSNATPVSLPTGPSIRMPVNTVLTLRGTGSVDADGDALVYAWSMTSKPAGSAAALSSSSASTVQLTPDLSGSYVVLLRVTDSAGAYSERSLVIDVGNYAPVAVVDKNRVTILSGAAIAASAGLSYDEDGDALTYQWTIDARPVGSVATIAAPAASALAFTPDLAGTYVAAVTVSDGKSSSVAYVNIKVLSSVASSVPLNFLPLQARYSKGLDKLVVVATNPNALKIIDPFTAAIKTVLLPVGVKSMNLSPDGKLAAVLHEGIVSLVDLDAATLIRSTSTGGAQTDAFLTNAGMIYMIGQTGGQWVDQAVGVIDGRTGTNLSATLGLGSWVFYGTQYGIYAPLKNKVFLMSQGLSPADIDYFTLSPTTGAVTSSGDSPYHGDYNMSTPLFLSGNEDLLFTSSGNFFRTDTLKYAGTFGLTGAILSMSHSSDADEALVMQSTYDPWTYQATYTTSYLRFTGALFLPEAAISLPVIDSAQSYGLGIFHSANGNHVALVQTGSSQQNGNGAKYYVTTR